MPDPGGLPAAGVEVVLVLRRTAHERTVVDVRTTEPPVGYGSVELGELPLLLEAVLADVDGGSSR
jgi:hypothetical protein